MNTTPIPIHESETAVLEGEAAGFVVYLATGAEEGGGEFASAFFSLGFMEEELGD